jgi:hypothetical protein
MHPIKFHTCTYCGVTEAFEPERPLYLFDWCSLLFDQHAHTKCHSKAMQQNRSPYTLRYSKDMTNARSNMFQKVDRYAKENFTCEKTYTTEEKVRVVKNRTVTYKFKRKTKSTQACLEERQVQCMQ